jgi:lipopolysaccharide export system protein LptC
MIELKPLLDKFYRRLNISYARYLKFKRADRYTSPDDVTYAEKHSRRVSFLKGLILRLIIGLTLVIIIWPFVSKHFGSSSKIDFQNDADKKTVSQPSGQPVMLKPNFFGNDDNGQPYNITSDSGMSLSENRTVLNNLTAEMALKDGSRIKLRSVRGDYANKDKRLILNDGVIIDTDSGYELKTNSAYVKLNENMATGSEKVHITGNLGEIDANGFTIRNSGDEIELFGGVDLTTQPDKAEGKAIKTKKGNDK